MARLRKELSGTNLLTRHQLNRPVIEVQYESLCPVIHIAMCKLSPVGGGLCHTAGRRLHGLCVHELVEASDSVTQATSGRSLCQTEPW